jgi:uncharacterized membrane protein YbjE (DUF340 family)
MVIPLPPGSIPLFTDLRRELTTVSTCPLLITSRHRSHRKHSSYTVALVSIVAERVYLAVAQKRP